MVFCLSIAFLVSNLYWFITIKDFKIVKDLNDSGILLGFSAANSLINKYGIKFYFYGIKDVFFVIFSGCFFYILYMYYFSKNNTYILIFLSIVFSFYMFFYKFKVCYSVYKFDSKCVAGYSAFSEIDLFVSVSGFTVYFLLFFVVFYFCGFLFFGMFKKK